MLNCSLKPHFSVLTHTLKLPLSLDLCPLTFLQFSYFICLAFLLSSPVLQALCEECECCSRSLAELGVSVQEFGEQNPLLCKQLGDAVAKLTELQRHTTQQVQDRANRLKKVRCSFRSTCHVDLPKDKVPNNDCM